MSVGAPGQITSLLQRLRSGDHEVAGQLLPLVYSELRQLAAAQMAGERANHTLQPTALVHEAVMRLLRWEQPDWVSRAQFYCAAATTMRHILVNHARDQQRLKRGGAARRVELDDAITAFEERSGNLVALHEALDRLAELNARHVEIVELRFFGGLSVRETAEILDISERTVKADWSMARAWLKRELASS